MKKILFLNVLILIFVNAQAAEFDGYIVKFKDHFGAYNLRNLSMEANLKSLDVSFGQFYKMTSKDSLIPLDIEKLKINPAIEYIEPNYIYYSQDHVEAKPKEILDKEFDGQWGVFNNGHNTWVANSPIGVDINVLKAWELTQGSNDIVVAIIDSGINYNHPDLKENLWINNLELNGKPGVDDDGNGYIDDVYGYDFANNDGDPLDDLGHGTHVAGIIGAAHNEIGTRGVMGKVSIMSLKFLSAKGSGDTANALKAIDYAVKNGAKIINNSWGGGDFSQSIYDALMNAAKNNIVVVTAAGNIKNDNDKYPKYPASYKIPGMICVGALNVLDLKTSFSSYGKESVHIFAPGEYIVSTDVELPYKWRSGTSIATPFVVGAVGLLLSKEPNLTPEEVKKRVISTSVYKDDYAKYGVGGRLNTYDLLTK